MTFRIYIFFFICLGLSWMPAQGENYENEITICSFNIRGSNMDTGVNASVEPQEDGNQRIHQLPVRHCMYAGTVGRPGTRLPVYRDL